MQPMPNHPTTCLARVNAIWARHEASSVYVLVCHSPCEGDIAAFYTCACMPSPCLSAANRDMAISEVHTHPRDEIFQIIKHFIPRRAWFILVRLRRFSTWSSRQAEKQEIKSESGELSPFLSSDISPLNQTHPCLYAGAF